MGIDTFHSELAASNQRPGYLGRALLDAYEQKEKSQAHALFISNGLDSNLYSPETLISDRISETYGSIRGIVETISAKRLVEFGNIPDGLDTMIERLYDIQEDVQEKLAKGMRWIGNRLNDFYLYISKLLPSSESLSSFAAWWNNVSFDWFVIKVTNALKYVARTFARGLALVFEALRNVIYKGIEFMSNVYGGLMDGIMKIPQGFSNAKRNIVKGLYFYLSSASDVSRYVVESQYLLKNRLGNFRSRLASSTRDVLASIREDEKEASSQSVESYIRESWFFTTLLQSSFAFVESIFSWIMTHLLWLSNTVRRMVSSAKAAFDSMISWCYVFGMHLGGHLQEVYQEITDGDRFVKSPLSKAIVNAQTLLDNAGEKLSSIVRSSLANAISIGEEVLDQDMGEANAQYVRSADGKSAKLQFQGAEDASELLTQIYFDEDVDLKRVSTVYSHYHGNDKTPFDQFYNQRDALSVLEANYTRAIAELLNPRLAIMQMNIGAQNDKEEEEEEEEEKKTIAELQDDFALADNRLIKMVRDLEQFELTSGLDIVRDATYLQNAEVLARNYASSEGSELSQVLDENQMLSLSLQMIEQNNSNIQQEWVRIMLNLVNAYNTRQDLAKRLNKRMTPIFKKKGRLRVWGFVASVCLPIVFYTLIYWFSPPGALWRPEEEAAKGFLNKLSDLITKKNIVVSTVSVRGALNLQTWINILLYFGDISAEKAPEFSVLVEYFAVVIAAIPSTIAIGLMIFCAVIIIGSFIIDFKNDVGIAQFTEPGALKFTTKNRFWHYLERLKLPGRTTMQYVFVRMSTMYIAIMTAKWDAIKKIAGAGAAFFTAANPFGSLVENAPSILPNQSKFEAAIQKLNLLPSNDVWNRILDPTKEVRGVDDDVRMFESIRDVLLELPENHPLITGNHIVKRLRLKQGGPLVEEVEEEEVDMARLLLGN